MISKQLYVSGTLCVFVCVFSIISEQAWNFVGQVNAVIVAHNISYNCLDSIQYSVHHSLFRAYAMILIKFCYRSFYYHQKSCLKIIHCPSRTICSLSGIQFCSSPISQYNYLKLERRITIKFKKLNFNCVTETTGSLLQKNSKHRAHIHTKGLIPTVCKHSEKLLFLKDITLKTLNL